MPFFRHLVSLQNALSLGLMEAALANLDLADVAPRTFFRVLRAPLLRGVAVETIFHSSHDHSAGVA